MSGQPKWTVRNVEPEALEMLYQVQAACGQTLGALVSDAIRAWYEDLPEVEDDCADHTTSDVHLEDISEIQRLLSPLVHS